MNGANLERENQIFDAWEEFTKREGQIELGIEKVNIVRFFTYQRMCLKRPFKVKESSEIYLDDKYRSVIEEIKASLLRGDGVEMYLSKQARKLRPDKMFLDFGILHLHLNKKIGDKVVDLGKAEDKTLQAYYSHGIVYLFNFGHHGFGAYTDPKIMQKLYDRFPNSLNDRVLNGNFKNEKITANERDQYHRSNLNTLIQVKDKDGQTINLAPYLMISTNGESGKDFALLDLIKNELQKKTIACFFRVLDKLRSMAPWMMIHLLLKT